jgi:hypothetical protein
MLTLTSQEIDYLAADFTGWCRQHAIAAPDVEAARAYFNSVHAHAPAAAELIDGDWEDFLAFLGERHLLKAR